MDETIGKIHEFPSFRPSRYSRQTLIILIPPANVPKVLTLFESRVNIHFLLTLVEPRIYQLSFASVILCQPLSRELANKTLLAHWSGFNRLFQDDNQNQRINNEDIGHQWTGIFHTLQKDTLAGA